MVSRLFRLGTLLMIFGSQRHPSVAVEANGVHPNFIFILADDLGYNDVSCYGQTQFQTPNLDRMAGEGMQFMSGYCSAPLCAPCRASLLTGLHNGHSPIRQNPIAARGFDRTTQGDPPLAADIPTLPKVFKQAGYETAVIGKWGMGRPDGAGSPKSVGFDYFFGYASHTDAHEYYPDHLWRNGEQVPLDKKTYSHDLFTKEALEFVRGHKEHPFFLYLAYTIPHVHLDPPTDEPYSDRPWPKPDRAYAAMIHRMDADVGKLIALLKELKIDENTLVIFSSDNGPETAGGHKSTFFHSAAPLRGMKRFPYEGGIRVPFIARWPGHVPAGRKTEQPVVFYDFVAMSSDLAGVAALTNTDGISFLPTLLGHAESQKQHDYFYWELSQLQGGFQEIRMGDWKAERLNVSRPGESTIELYNLKTDIAETNNVAAEHPEIVKKIEEIAAEAHRPNLMFPLTVEEAKQAQPSRVTPRKKG